MLVGSNCKKRKVRQANASTREATQATTSARVRLEGIVGFVSVVGITFAVWGELRNCEKLLNSRSRKSRLSDHIRAFSLAPISPELHNELPIEGA
jgi:hypothetical protein